MADHDEAREQRPADRLEALDAAVRRRLKETHHQATDAVPSRQLTRLLEVSRAMNRTHDRDQLLGYVNERLRELFDAQNAFVVLFDDHGRPVIEAAHESVPAGGVLPVSETLIERVRHMREPIIINDTAEHSELRDRSSIARLKIASVLCAPLIVEDEVIGVLQFDQRGDPLPFPESDLRLLSLFADQVATALYNLRLIEQKAQAMVEMREAQEQLVQAERLSALGEMAGGIAHNFNNTLFVALGLCDVLLAKDSLDGEARASVDRIRTCALDAANTVRRLQVFARGDAVDDRTRTVLLTEMVDEMRELTRHKWRGEAGERGVTIEVRTEAGGTPLVRANPAEIREVLTNLIFNAVDAMEESGAIVLRSGESGSRAFFSVTDEGTGMDDATLKQVFEPCFTTKGARGYGFGLSTCWSIARRLGGEVTVDSSPGRGSTFTLWLPLAPQVSTPAATASPGGRDRAHVLVIDDDAAVLEVIGELLDAIGHRCDTYVDAAEGLRAFDGGRYDVVISDLGMPGLTGNDVARSVVERRPEIPVILLTGWGSDVELEPDVATMVADVLAKPVTLQVLESALSRARLASAEPDDPGRGA
jgi:signal transduction histidine kinase/ActR/RegA family two-component response regulator